MKLLAIDTSASISSVGLMIDDVIDTIEDASTIQQAQVVLPLIDRLLQSHQLALQDLDAIVFGCGPGSFTGVRVACSVAQGLSFGSHKPLIKISSLAATAQAAFMDLGWRNLWVAMDARIQEVYWGLYQVNAEGLVTKVREEVLCPPRNCSVLEGEGYGIGTGWSVYQDDLLAALKIAPLAVDATRMPLAKGLLTLAKAKFLSKDFTEMSEALPSYLRDEVAKKSV